MMIERVLTPPGKLVRLLQIKARHHDERNRNITRGIETSQQQPISERKENNDIKSSPIER